MREVRRRRALVAALGGLLLFAVALVAVDAWAGPAGDSEEAARLVARLGERYEVLELSRSYVLRPRADDAGFGWIEVGADTFVVDGETRSTGEVRELLGENAADVERLAELVAAPAAAAPPVVEAPVIESPTAPEPPRRVEEEPSPPAPIVEEAPSAEPEREPRPARRRIDSDTRMSFGGSVTVEEDEVARDLVAFGGRVEVRGKVRGDVVLFGGEAEIDGEVRGDVFVVGGSVKLGSNARVRGEVVTIGGEIDRRSGARVGGELTELSFDPWEGFGDVDWQRPWWTSADWTRPWPGFAWAEVAGLVFRAVLLAILMLLALYVARDHVAGIAERARFEPWKAGLVGLAVQLLLVPVLVLVSLVLLISIVGIPLLVLLLPLTLLAVLVVSVLGYAGIALLAGRFLEDRFRLRELGPYAAVVLGVALIQGWQIVGQALSFVSWPIAITAWILILLGAVVKYLAWTVGLGSVLLERFDPLPAAPAALPPAPLADD